MRDEPVKILFGDIPPHGVKVRADLAKSWAADAAQVTLGAPPLLLSLDLLVMRTGRYRAEVTGRLSASAPSTCNRCLCAVQVAMGGDVSLLYTTPDTAGTADIDAITNGDDDARLDVGWFDGVTLDMGHVVTEQLALWEPPRIICDDAAVTRKEDGACKPITYDRSEEIKRTNPFAQLASLKLPE
jgi:uncharacterized metal-binding protein YceD (DUF177 family)